MGIYLSKPNTEKQSGKGENAKVSFGYSSMQGWRMHMEDAHIANGQIADNISIFAVFDGHGGAEVAKFCADNFIPNLLKNENFKKGDYVTALRENFLAMDEILQSDNGQSLLKKY